MDTIAEVEGGRRRRRHSDAFKAKVVTACLQPGVSTASVALAHGLNANLLRRWVASQRTGRAGVPDVVSSTLPDGPQSFVPLALGPSPAQTGDIHIDLARNDLKVSVTWPAAASAECGEWLRELMR